MDENLMNKKIFFRFLKEYNLYDKYIRNMNKYLKDDFTCINALLSKSNPIDSFTWSRSYEGRDFWVEKYYMFNKIHTRRDLDELEIE